MFEFVKLCQMRRTPNSVTSTPRTSKGRLGSSPTRVKNTPPMDLPKSNSSQPSLPKAPFLKMNFRPVASLSPIFIPFSIMGLQLLGKLSNLALVQKKLDPSVFKIGCSQAGKNKWVEMGKQVSRKVQHVEDKVKDLLIRVQTGLAISKEDINSLKARKLIVAQTWKGYSVRKGPNYAPKRKKVATDLTRENLQKGDWKELEFKEYNFNAKGPPAESGHLHPLLKVKQQLKNIFLQLGWVLSFGINLSCAFKFYITKTNLWTELILRSLIGVLNDFFSCLGMSKLRFKPAYNPYTERSMEIFSYHEGLKK
ncbi:hypothetical protein GQ457_04G002130 [Hibiscus cannabinus]